MYARFDSKKYYWNIRIEVAYTFIRDIIFIKILDVLAGIFSNGKYRV